MREEDEEEEGEGKYGSPETPYAYLEENKGSKLSELTRS
jgi:hypothetical protein